VLAHRSLRPSPAALVGRPSVPAPNAPAPARPPATTGHSIGQLPIQPAWEYVQVGTRQRRYNLRDNKDGTFTHSKTGEVFSHQGATLKTGERLLAPVVSAPISPPTPTPQLGAVLSHDPKNVLFRINENGKVEYLANTAQNRLTYAGKYLEQSPADFHLFKSGGKRSSSSKVMDPVTLQRYFYDEAGGQFYEWDAKTAGKGKAVSTTAGPSNAPSANQQLLDRLTKGELVDRRRKDRSNEDLQPFDVGTYKSNITLPSETHPKRSVTVPKLTGIPAWTPKGGDVNRDHIPSGESLNQRGDSGAYNQGITIAIPNPEFHLPFSPTFGTDNSTSKGYQDDYGGTQIRRIHFDKDNSGTAAFRDTQFILNSTENQDFSTGHSFLDLTKQENRLRQLGGYRRLNRLNVKLHKKYGSQRGFDPKAKAIRVIHKTRKAPSNKKKGTKRKVGGFDYTDIANLTVGDQFVELYREHLLRTKRANLI
jgi:hypothetical protein